MTLKKTLCQRHNLLLGKQPNPKNIRPSGTAHFLLDLIFRRKMEAIDLEFPFLGGGQSLQDWRITIHRFFYQKEIPNGIFDPFTF
jgi:hypothetical protein